MGKKEKRSSFGLHCGENLKREKVMRCREKRERVMQRQKKKGRVMRWDRKRVMGGGRKRKCNDGRES